MEGRVTVTPTTLHISLFPCFSFNLIQYAIMKELIVWFVAALMMVMYQMVYVMGLAASAVATNA